MWSEQVLLVFLGSLLASLTALPSANNNNYNNDAKKSSDKETLNDALMQISQQIGSSKYFSFYIEKFLANQRICFWSF